MSEDVTQELSPPERVILSPTLISAPERRGFAGWLAGPDWSYEDRWLKLALKIGLVLGVLALEAIVIATVAILMLRTVW